MSDSGQEGARPAPSFFDGVLPPPEDSGAEDFDPSALYDRIYPDWRTGPALPVNPLTDPMPTDPSLGSQSPEANTFPAGFADITGMGGFMPSLADNGDNYDDFPDAPSWHTQAGLANLGLVLSPGTGGNSLLVFPGSGQGGGTVQLASLNAPIANDASGGLADAGQDSSFAPVADAAAGGTGYSASAVGQHTPNLQFASSKTPTEASGQNSSTSPEQVAKSPPFNFTDDQLKQIHDQAERQIALQAAAKEAGAVGSEFLPGNWDKISPIIHTYNNISEASDPQRVEALYQQMLSEK